MSRIVMLTKFLPSPADSGGKIRSMAEAVRLARLGTLTLLAFEEGEPNPDDFLSLDIDARGFAKQRRVARLARGVLRTRSITAGRFWSPALASALLDLGSDPVDVLFVGHAQMAPYMPLVGARHTILDLHNVESALAQSYRASVGGLRAVAASGEALALRRLERRAMATFDTVLTVSQRDRDRLPGGSADVLVCPNGTGLEDVPERSPHPTAVFVALMGWTPNVDAACHFTRRVWPLVRARVAGGQLLLVGRDPTPEVMALAAEDVEVTGRVPSVRPYLERARVALAPLLAGGGSRLKILEALAAGRPVVATTVGAEGLEDLIGRGVVLADDPKAMADAVADLLLDPDRADRLGREGRAAVAAHYGWDATLAPLVERVTTLLGG